jgi:tRNA (guanine-N7-)-methyltransferase
MGARVESDVPLDPRQKYALAPRLPGEGPVDVRRLVGSGPSRFEIEVGPGRGGFLLGRLAAREDVGLIGFEIKRKWTVLVNERLARHGYGERGRVLAEDVRLAFPRLGPDGSIAAFFFHFPDPWWKKRHHKRLVIGTDVLDQVARLLGAGGELFVQTDVEDRAAAYETQIAAHPAFSPHGDSPASARLAENPYGARSHREVRALADAIPIYRLRFVKR